MTRLTAMVGFSCLQEMNLVLEEDFLDILISWALNLPVDELWSTASRQGVMATDGTQEVHSSDAYGQYRDGGSMALCGSDQLMKSIFTELGGAAAKRLSGLAAQSPLGPSRGKWYFEVLHIQPLKVMRSS